MKAICITSRPNPGELDKSVELKDLPVPEPGKNEIRIKVIASAINIDDVHLAEGTMFGGLSLGPKPSQSKLYIPGIDVAGIVDAVGQGVKSLKVGQEVYGICNTIKGQGAWAEYCITKSANVAVKPKVWNFREAAACASSGAVVVSMVKAAMNVANKRCLVIGASGGIGTLCVQALKQENARVWGVCSHRNTEVVRKIGAERVIDYTKAPFSEQIQDLDEQVDVVFDLVGGKELERGAFSVLASTGTFVTIVGPNQYVGEKNIGVIGALSSFAYVGWRMLWTRMQTGPSYVFTGAATPDFSGINAMLVASGSKPIIDTEVSLTREDVSAAIHRVTSHRAVGKVIVNVGGWHGINPTKKELKTMTISNKRKNNVPSMHKDKQFEAIVIGGTGGIGAHLVSMLLKSPLYSKVTVISRKSIPHDPKLNVIIWNDFSNALLIDPEKAIKVFENHHVLFCCLGASESEMMGLIFNKKKYAKRFETVDYDYVVGAAVAAHHAGVPYFSVISSANANPNAKFLYLRIKGKMESALQDINFRGLSIFQPSSLLKPAQGNEHYFRRMSKNLTALISRILPFEQKAIFVEDVAKAMKKEFEMRLTEQKEGVSFLQSDCMRGLLAKQ